MNLIIHLAALLSFVISIGLFRLRSKSKGYRWIALAFYCIAIALFYFQGGISESIRSSNKREYYTHRVQSEAHRLDMIIDFQKKTAMDMATTLNVFQYTSDVLNIMIKSSLFNQYNVFGTSIAYDLSEDSTLYCPYIYKSGDSLVIKDLNFIRSAI